MAYTKQTWTDHVSSRPHTYNETVNGDGTKTFTPAGTVEQQGSPMTAERFNHMEDGIYSAQSTADNAATAAGNAAQAAADNLVTAKNYADEKAAAETGAHADVDITTGVHGLKYDPDSNKFKRKNGNSWEDINIGVTLDENLDENSHNGVENAPIAKAINELRSVTLVVDAPAQSGTLTYNGSSQSPTWTGYDNTKLTIGGTTSGTNAGSYAATFTPISPYMWSDGTRIAKTVNWSIGRAAGTLSLSSTSVTTLKNASTAVTLTTNSDGTKSAESNATGKVTASVSGTTVTLTGGSTSGSATVTVSIAQSTNYTAVSKTISVNNIVASSTLSSNTPDVIKAVAQAGQASNLWSVGDKTSGISISGTVGSLSLNGTYYAFILGFNHNSSREGSNSIHFALGMTSGGTRIAFCDSKYGSQGSGAYFNMNTTNTNSGGWSSSYMRSTILPAFKNAIASAWRNVMASVTKYSDNTGGGSDTASYVTSTTDILFLLAEFEVQGTRSYANSKEKDYQQQYTYFANGNGKIFYKHDATSTACIWWLRSVYASNSNYFCFVNTDGSANNYYAFYSLGVVLGFVIK